MKFKLESELVEKLKSSLKRTYSRNNIQIFEEVSLGYGIADIVVSELKKSYEETTDSKLTLLDVSIYLFFLREHRATIIDLCATTGCNKKSVSKAIRKLIQRGYLKEDREGIFLVKNYELPFRLNFAIEAKLSDWKRALKQAYRYKWFAEYSYVVLDSHYAALALKNIDHFEKYNVGLASIDIDGNLNRHFKPKRETPVDPKMQILFSEQIQNLATC